MKKHLVVQSAAQTARYIRQELKGEAEGQAERLTRLKLYDVALDYLRTERHKLRTSITRTAAYIRARERALAKIGGAK